MNKLLIIGNLGADPEMRIMPDGTPITSFNIADNRRYTDKSGERHEETTWFRISVFNRMAEVCHEHLTKGRKVFVEGRLTPEKETGGPRVWTNRDGQPSASYEVRATDVIFLDSLGEGSQEPAAGEPRAVKQESAGKQDPLAGF